MSAASFWATRPKGVDAGDQADPVPAKLEDRSTRSWADDEADEEPSSLELDRARLGLAPKASVDDARSEDASASAAGAENPGNASSRAGSVDSINRAPDGNVIMSDKSYRMLTQKLDASEGLVRRQVKWIVHIQKQITYEAAQQHFSLRYRERQGHRVAMLQKIIIDAGLNGVDESLIAEESYEESLKAWELGLDVDSSKAIGMVPDDVKEAPAKKNVESKDKADSVKDRNGGESIEENRSSTPKANVEADQVDEPATMSPPEITMAIATVATATVRGKKRAATSESRIPEPCDLEGPVFSTAETIKKTAPLPSAPTLKMPMDLSTYGKTPAKTNSSPKTKPVKAAVRAFDQKIFPAVPTFINPGADVRCMKREQRLQFGEGGRINIMVAKLSWSVPKFMFMQVSRKALEYFKENPNARTMEFSPEVLHIPAMHMIASWMREQVFLDRVYSINLQKVGKENLLMLRTVHLIDLRSLYVSHITKGLCEDIRGSVPPPFELVSDVAEVSQHPGAVVFDCLANNLAMIRHRKLVAEPRALEELLAKYPVLLSATNDVQSRLSKHNAEVPIIERQKTIGKEAKKE